MKKFISLALALVMALSLTTVAFGANEAKIVETDTEYATVEAAVAAATAGQTVLMLTDATVEATLVVDGITLDGDGNTLFADAALGGMDEVGTENDNMATIWSTVGCTIKNLTIEGGWKGIIIQGTATQDTLLENVTIVKSARGINFNFASSPLTVSTAGLTVKNSTISGWCGIKTDGDVIFDNTVFVENESDRGSGLNPRNEVTLTNCTFDAGTVITTEDLPADEAIAINGGIYNGELADVGAGTFVISGGTFSVLPDEDYLVDGVTFIGNTVGVLDKKATSYDNLYAKNTNAPTAPAAVVDIVVTPAKAPKYEQETGYLDTEGNIEYVNITGDGTYYKFVNTLAEADVVLYTDAASKIVKFYLAEIETPYYLEGIAFNNFGEKCGQVDYDEDDGYDKTLKYFTIKGADMFILAEEAEEYACDGYVLYNGKMIPVVALGYDKVPHAVVSESENGKTVKVYCGKCGLNAVEAANRMSIPKGADTTGLPNYWYWAGTAVAPSTDKTVTSAQTFDAGIAMYVGMSVMAAAGSAVVIGKKKD